MVDEDRRELVTNSLVHKLRRDGRVHSTADGSQNPTVSDELPYPTDLLLHEIAHGPVLGNAADVDGEVLQQLCAIWRVGDFWVELDSVDWLSVVGNGGVLGVLGGGDGVEPLGQLAQLVAVGHPHLHAALDALEQAVGMGVDALGIQLCHAVLPVSSTSHNVLAIQAIRKLLETVAYSKNRDVEIEECRVDVWRSLIVDGVRPSTEDEADRLELQLGELGSARQHLRVDIELTKSADDAIHILSSVIRLGQQ